MSTHTEVHDGKTRIAVVPPPGLIVQCPSCGEIVNKVFFDPGTADACTSDPCGCKLDMDGMVDLFTGTIQAPEDQVYDKELGASRIEAHSQVLEVDAVKSSRSGTENRQRRHQVNVRLNDEEYADLEVIAKRHGITMAETLRRLSFGWDGMLA